MHQRALRKKQCNLPFYSSPLWTVTMMSSSRTLAAAAAAAAALIKLPLISDATKVQIPARVCLRYPAAAAAAAASLPAAVTLQPRKRSQAMSLSLLLTLIPSRRLLLWPFTLLDLWPLSSTSRKNAFRCNHRTPLQCMTAATCGIFTVSQELLERGLAPSSPATSLPVAHSVVIQASALLHSMRNGGLPIFALKRVLSGALHARLWLRSECAANPSLLICNGIINIQRLRL